MLTLYEHPLSAYAMKVKMALLEKGLEFEALLPEGMATGTASGAFVEANPRAEVPTLIDGEVKVFDSTVILEYLEDKWPSPPLLPKSPAERARVRMIEDVMDSVYEPNNWGVMEVTRFKRASGPLADKLVGFAKSNIDQLQHWLDGKLGSKPWFNGDTLLRRHRLRALHQPFRGRGLHPAGRLRARGLADTRQSASERGQGSRTDEAGHRQLP
jgi:glutathione S-transferase/RNA polymerase-associated protein